MKRRKFLQDSSMLAMSIGIFGNIKWDGQTYVGDNPTTTDILGPFYRPGAPFKTDLVQAGTKGEILHFSGTIWGHDGKTPVKNALVEIWHCNEDGVYDNTTDNFVYRAAWKTGADGRYHFKTILPVPYVATANLTRPAHIHMRISGNDQQDLVTQVYFKGDLHIEKDISAGDPRAMSRILDVTKNAHGEKDLKFDIILQKEYVLEAAAFKKITGLYEMSDKTTCEFYREGDQLFLKLNGQIMEAMDYRGDNKFEGGLGQMTAEFELLKDGAAKVKGTYTTDNRKKISYDGTRYLKY